MMNHVELAPGIFANPETGEFADADPAPAAPPSPEPPPTPAAPSPTATPAKKTGKNGFSWLPDTRPPPADPELHALRIVESADGETKDHDRGKDETAGSSYGIEPSTFRDVVNHHPALAQKYGGLTHLEPDQITDALNSDDAMSEDVASAFWSDLKKRSPNPIEARMRYYAGNPENPHSAAALYKRLQAGDDLHGHNLDVALDVKADLARFSTALAHANAQRPDHAPAGYSPVSSSLGLGAGAGAGVEASPSGIGNILQMAAPNPREPFQPAQPGIVSPPEAAKAASLAKLQEDVGKPVFRGEPADNGGPPPPARQPLTPDEEISAPEASGASAAPAAKDPADELLEQIRTLQQGVVADVNGTKGWTKEQQDKLSGLLSDVQNAKIDPNRVFANMSTGHRIMAAIALGLGAFAQGMTHGAVQNPAAQMMHDAIAEDIEAQKEALGKKTTIYSMALQAFGNEKQARAATWMAENQVLHSMVDEYKAMKAGGIKPGVANQLAGLESAKKAAEQYASELAGTPPGILGAAWSKIPGTTAQYVAAKKPIIATAISDGLRSGKFSPAIIREIESQLGDVGQMPGLRSALMKAIIDHLQTRIDELRSGGAPIDDDVGTGPAEAQAPDDYEESGGE